MKIEMTRDSVCAGDDIHAPHTRRVTMPDEIDVQQIVRAITQANYLPLIDGGEATWCVSSAIPLAVIAQQWRDPRYIQWSAPKVEELDWVEDVLRIHVTYYVQEDPEVVLNVLQRLRLRP